MDGIEKTEGKVIVRHAKGHAVYSAPEDSFLIHRMEQGGKAQVSKVKDLTDAQLLLALVNLVKIEG